MNRGLLTQFILQKWFLIPLLERKLIVVALWGPFNSWSFFGIISIFFLLITHIFVLILRTDGFRFVWLIVFIFIFRFSFIFDLLPLKLNLLFVWTLLFALTRYFFGLLARFLVNCVFFLIIFINVIIIFWALRTHSILLLLLSHAHLFKLFLYFKSILSCSYDTSLCNLLAVFVVKNHSHGML